MRKYRDKLKKSSCNHKGARGLQTANTEREVGAVSRGDLVELTMGFARPMDAISVATLQTLRSRFAITCPAALIDYIVGKAAHEALRIINRDLADGVDRPPSGRSRSPLASYLAQSRSRIPSQASKVSRKRLLRSLRRCSLKASSGQRRFCRRAQRKAARSRSQKHLCNRWSFSMGCRQGSRTHGARLKHSHHNLRLPNDVATANSTNRTLPRLFSLQR
ncbi:iron-sulfur cluster assembly scaffold protein (plasmid) [Rhizobium sp. CB3171]|uniref:iron-sulfur cluster assembly scaffold protein n=1 Tax=Rhizobium sp. CB3171 TaxID=3039157 RepID=UPI0024B0FE1E|nr:iron-sulfur cluster assembly scaffold protein [Rhizobium sp. CB3171]WFU07061.1 iron-sulfur cluster assembly scaffold protein [Rhizobium sp. CB3171]